MDIDLIQNRREKVEQEIARLTVRIEGLTGELNELETAERVLERLSGKKPVARDSSGNKKDRPPRRKKPEGMPSTSEMVFAALRDAEQRGLNGLAPKGIREYVLRVWDYNIGSAANSVPSRMWREQKVLAKDEETGLFSLPKEIEAKDTALESKPSLASLFAHHAKDREAGSGGGP